MNKVIATFLLLISTIFVFPQTSQEYFNKGIDKIDTENYIEAIKDLSKAIELDSEFEYAYFSRGYAFYMINNYSNAIKGEFKRTKRAI